MLHLVVMLLDALHQYRARILSKWPVNVRLLDLLVAIENRLQLPPELLRLKRIVGMQELFELPLHLCARWLNRAEDRSLGMPLRPGN